MAKLDDIKIYYQQMQQHYGDYEIDSITWNDLEMDEVFEEINETESYIGEQVLYSELHDIKLSQDWDAYEERIAFFEENEADASKIRRLLRGIGKCSADYHLPNFIFNTDIFAIKNAWKYHVLQILLVGFIIACFLVESPIPPAGVVVVGLINLMIYMKEKMQYEVVLYSLGSVRQLVGFCEWMLANKATKELFGTEEVVKATESLKKVSKAIGKFHLRKQQGLTGDISALLQDYLFGITLYDLSVFNFIIKKLDGKQKDLLTLYKFIGNVEVSYCVAEYRRKQRVCCIPKIGEAHKLVVTELVHPMIPDAVSNDFEMNRPSLVTGANASGKSTFMKAVAINVVLAQTIHTCTATAFQIPKLLVMTSMALRDDVVTGESYYVREVKYLKRMLDLVDNETPVLYVIDEILKGTNTRERVAASEAVLEYMAAHESMVIVATHDRELVNHLEDHFDTYYFESHIKGEDIVFDYKIHKGIGGGSNAIELLRCMDFPNTIVQRARDLLSKN